MTRKKFLLSSLLSLLVPARAMAQDKRKIGQCPVCGTKPDDGPFMTEFSGAVGKDIIKMTRVYLCRECGCVFGRDS